MSIIGSVQKSTLFSIDRLSTSVYLISNILRFHLFMRYTSLDHIFRYGFLLGICLTFSTLGTAQKGVEVGAHVGLAHYFGDLNPTFAISDPNLHLGLKFRRNFNERVCAAVGLEYGKLSGSDSNSFNSFERSRNLDFRTNYVEANFTLEFNFFPYIHGSEDYNYTPYLFGGFSVGRYNPQAELNGETHALRELATEQTVYSLVSGGLVYGFGVKWDVNRDFSINVDLSGRRLFDDFIDDVSGNYPNNIPSDPIAAVLSNRSEDTNFGLPGTQRGDGRNRDSVYFLSIGILRYFSTLSCPPISRNVF